MKKTIEQQKQEASFNFHAQSMDLESRDKAAELRRAYELFSHKLIELCPDSRHKSLAITALEESAMWATKSISHTPKPNQGDE